MLGFRVIEFAFGICFPRTGFVRLYKFYSPVNKYPDNGANGCAAAA
jgi:hypothetical protein